MGTSQSKQNQQGDNSNALNNGNYKSHLDDWPWVWAIRDPSCLDWKNGLDSETIQAHALMQQKMPVPIVANSLYLGNAASIQNISYLKELGITSVLNMAGPMCLPSKTIKALKANNISYHRIDAQDEFDYPLLEKHWEEANAFIEESIQKNHGKCVVHCVAGMNRSVLVAAAYYMINTNTTVLETVGHVRKQRGNHALQNEGFQEQLVAMARRNVLLGPKPGTPDSSLPVPMLMPSDFGSARTQVNRSNPLDRISS